MKDNGEEDVDEPEDGIIRAESNQKLLGEDPNKDSNIYNVDTSEGIFTRLIATCWRGISGVGG
jgi:hypothetical protein